MYLRVAFGFMCWIPLPLSKTLTIQTLAENSPVVGALAAQ